MTERQIGCLLPVSGRGLERQNDPSGVIGDPHNGHSGKGKAGGTTSVSLLLPPLHLSVIHPSSNTTVGNINKPKLSLDHCGRSSNE